MLHTPRAPQGVLPFRSRHPTVHIPRHHAALPSYPSMPHTSVLIATHQTELLDGGVRQENS